MTSETVMLPYQSKILTEKRPIVMVEKSRRIGLSWAFAFKAVHRALKGTNQWYTGYNLSMAAEFISDCALWADAFNAGYGEIGCHNDIFVASKRSESVFNYKIEFANGAKITALSSKPINLRSKQGDNIIDEAAFHPDLPGIRKAAIAQRIWGGNLTVLSTHNGYTNHFYEWLQDIREGNAQGAIHSVNFRQAISEGLYRRICLMNGEDWSAKAEDEWVAERYAEYGDDADEELDVIPSKGRDGYIPVNAIERCMVQGRPLIRLALDDKFTELPSYEREIEITRWFYVNVAPYMEKLPANARHFLGCDFARSGDKTVFAPLTETESITYDNHLLLELHNVPFDEQAQLFFLLVGMLPNLTRICLDSAGNGSWLSEKAKMKLGSRSVGINANAAHYNEYMPKLKAAFQHDHISVPRHTDVLQDIRAISIVKGVPKVSDKARRKGTDGLPRHGDVAMALYMAWVATDMGGYSHATGTRAPAPRHRDRKGSMWDMR